MEAKMTLEEFKNDWRNMGQLEYMFGKKIKHIDDIYQIQDHAHCRFCWDKISALPDALHDGYYTVNTKYRYWICPECYEDLKDIFQWSLEK